MATSMAVSTSRLVDGRNYARQRQQNRIRSVGTPLAQQDRQSLGLTSLVRPTRLCAQIKASLLKSQDGQHATHHRPNHDASANFQTRAKHKSYVGLGHGAKIPELVGARRVDSRTQTSNAFSLGTAIPCSSHVAAARRSPDARNKTGHIIILYVLRIFKPSVTGNSNM